MNLIDLLVLAIIAISALLGLSRGFVREMLGLASWLLAAYAAYRLSPQLIPFAERTIGNPDIAGVTAYVVTFLGCLIVLSLLSNLVGRIVRFSALGGLDRTLGLVFGVVRGAAVLIAAYILAAARCCQRRKAWPPQIKAGTHRCRLLYEGARWFCVANYLPEAVSAPRWSLPPPDENPLTSAQLLHVTPDGAALGPRPHTDPR